MKQNIIKSIIKRDGRKDKFNSDKIYDAILTAATSHNYALKHEELVKLVEAIVSELNNIEKESIDVETIQDIVVNTLKKNNHHSLSKSYDEFRRERTKNREMRTKLMNVIQKIGVQTDRDNANVGNNFSAKLLRIASEANKWAILGSILPPDMAKAHEIGDFYIHDLDSYNLTINCLHVPTKKLLEKGFNTGYGLTNPPKSISTAAALTCIILQSSQNDMFGGQAHPNFDNDLSPYVELSRQKIRKNCIEIGIPKNELDRTVERLLIKEVRSAMQAVVYNLNTMHSRAGAQVPFSSLNIGLCDNADAAMLSQALLEEYLKGMGAGEQPIFPNIVFRVKKGLNREPNDKYYYLFQLACHVASKRMNPTFMNIDTDYNLEWYEKGVYPATMGCRTYVLPNINGAPGTAGRGNIAPVTMNIVRLASQAKGDIDVFFNLLDEMMEKCRLQLMHRYSVLKKLKVNDLPFSAGQKLLQGSEDLELDDSIEPILKQGTYGIGFIGLAEVLRILTGKHHGESEESQKLGVKIVTHIRNKCDEYKQKYKLNFSCYATPAEGLSSKFTSLDKKYLGEIDWITSKNFYTNSFHIPVDYPISYAKKMEIEAPYHKLCNAGHISYIEFDAAPDAETIEKITRAAFTKTNIGYIGFNFHIRYCLDCIKTVRKLKYDEHLSLIKEHNNAHR